MKIKNTKILFKKMNILSESLCKAKTSIEKGLHSFKINFHEKNVKLARKVAKKLTKEKVGEVAGKVKKILQKRETF